MNDTIFILRFSALGDVAMTIPPVYAVARANPACRFVYFTKAGFSGLFVDAPSNLKVIGLDDIGPLHVYRRLRKEIRLHKPALIADLHNVSRTWLTDLYAMLHGIRVGCVNKRRLFRHSALKRKSGQRNFIDRYLDVFTESGLETSRANMDTLPPMASPPVPIRQPAVGIAPFARFHTKTYPLDKMEEVITSLTKNNVNVYLFGAGGKEQKQLDEWPHKYPCCHSMAGRYTLQEEMSAIQSLPLMLSMDSANQHIASLVGTKVITIWGATAPLCGFAPFRQSPGNSIVAGLPCQPCSIAGSRLCPEGHFDCMHSIEPNHIVDKILHELSLVNNTEARQ